MLDPEIKNTINQFFISSRAKRQETLQSNITEATNDLAKRNMLSSSVAVNNISQVYKDEVKLRFQDAWESIKKNFEKKKITFTKEDAKDVEQLLKQLVNNEIDYLSKRIDTRFRRKEGPLDFNNSILIGIASSRNSIFPVISADLNFFISLEDVEKENDSELHIKIDNSDSQEVEKISKEKNTEGKKDVLKPKPPQIIENIKWLIDYGPKHWKIVIIALIILAVPVIYKLYNSSPKFDPLTPTKSLTNSSPVNDEAGSQKKNTFPVLRMKFTDGSEALVSLTCQVVGVPEDIPKAFALFGSYEKAIESLHSSVRSAAYSVLESQTLNYIRLNRDKLSKLIVDKTKTTQEWSEPH
jgi:hypothetical protein